MNFLLTYSLTLTYCLWTVWPCFIYQVQRYGLWRRPLNIMFSKLPQSGESDFFFTTYLSDFEIVVALRCLWTVTPVCITKYYAPASGVDHWILCALNLALPGGLIEIHTLPASNIQANMNLSCCVDVYHVNRS